MVTWTLTPNARGGTRLLLEHDGFTAEQESTFMILKQGWSDKVLAALARTVGGLRCALRRIPRGFPLGVSERETGVAALR